MKKIFQLLVLTAFIAGTSAVAHAAPKVIAAKFHADYCGSCKAIAPAHEEVIKKYNQGDVLFVTFDKSDEGTTHQSKLMAHALGVNKAYDAYAKTGFVLLIDADSKEVKGKLTKVHTPAQMSKAIDMVLAGQNVMDDMKGSDKKGIKMDSKKGSQKKGSY